MEGYKKTKLGWLPLDWEVVPIYELRNKDDRYSFTGGPFGSDLKSEHYTEKGVRIIQLQNIGEGAFVDKSAIYTSESKADELKACNIYPNEIILAKMAPVARSCIIPTSCSRYLMCSDGIRLSVNSVKYNNKFIFYALNSTYFRNNAESKSTGTTRARIGLTDLKGIPIAIPKEKIEQQKIANCLSQWDKAIQLQEQLIQQKTLQKKWLMQQLLTGKKRLPGFEGAWQEKDMKEVFIEIKDKNDGQGHEPLTISAKKGFVSQKQKFDRVIAGGSLGKYTQLKKGDFAYNKGNSKTYQMGCIYLLENYQTAVVPFVYICFRAKGDTDSYFYKHWFVNHGLDRQLKRIITSGARGDGLLNVNKKSFFTLRIPVPPIKEQKAISKILNQADQELTLLNKKLDQLKAQKKGLMQQLLTGKKRLV